MIGLLRKQMWKCICGRIEGLNGIDTFTDRSGGSFEKRELLAETWSKAKATFKAVGVSLSMARTGHGEVFLL